MGSFWGFPENRQHLRTPCVVGRPLSVLIALEEKKKKKKYSQVTGRVQTCLSSSDHLGADGSRLSKTLNVGLGAVARLHVSVM